MMSPLGNRQRNVSVPRWMFGLVCLWLLVIGQVQAQNSFLQQVDTINFPDGRVQVRFSFDAPPPLPKSYAVKKSNSLVLDLWGVESDLTYKKRKFPEGRLKRLNFTQTDGRLRITAFMNQDSDYHVYTEANHLFLELATPFAQYQQDTMAMDDKPKPVTRVQGVSFEQIDEIGRVKIALSDDKAGVDIIEEGNNVLVNFVGARLSPTLDTRLPLQDLSSPLLFIDAMGGSSQSSVFIKPGPEPYEFKAYQLGNTIVLDFVAELVDVPDDERDPAVNEYYGAPMDLSMQEVSRRAVLQTIAEVAGRNLVVADSVAGNISLRLLNVPWDQALELVLDDANLQQRMLGDIILVAYPTDLDEVERVERQRIELARLKAEQKRQAEENSPQLRAEFLQLEFSSAERIVAQLKTENLISPEGFVQADEENSIITLRETEPALEIIRQRVTEWDRKAEQVKVEAVLVMADPSVSRELGIRWGGRSSAQVSDGKTMAVGFAPVTQMQLNSVLAAMQQKGQALLVSEPKILTLDGMIATLEAGRELPFRAVSNATATGTFSDVVISLDVTPRVAKGDRVAMDLLMKQSSLKLGAVPGGVNVADDQMRTSMVIADQQTLVLGGVFNSVDHRMAGQAMTASQSGTLPVLGNLFRNTENSSRKTELLIFVTPTLVRSGMSIN